MGARLALRSGSVGRFAFASIGLALVASDPAPASAAQDRVVKLSGTPPFTVTGYTGAAKVTRDGTWVVYEASQDAEGAHLFSVPIRGGQSPIELAGPIVPYLAQFEIDPSGAFVVYHAGYRLFSVPIDASAAPIQLDRTGGEVYSGFEIGFGRVVFVANGRLQSVPITGGRGPIELHGGLPIYGTPRRISPDGSMVLYIADEVDDTLGPALYVVPIDGSASPKRLSHPQVAHRGVASFVLDARARMAVFLSDQLQDGRFELFSVPVDGNREPVKVSGPLGPFTGIEEYLVDGRGTRVVYRANHDQRGVTELYSVPIEGGAAPVKLNVRLAGQSEVLRDFQISADGQHVVHRVFMDGTSEVFSTEIDGGLGPIRLNAPLAPSATVIQFLISPDGRWVVYRTWEGPAGNLRSKLYRAPISGRFEATLLSGPNQNVGGYGVDGAAISADSEHVVYKVEAFYSVRLDGSEAPVRLSPPPVSHGYLHRFFVSPDGKRVLYTSEQERYDVPELYSVPIDAGQTQDVDDVFELYSVPVDGSAAPLRLNAAFAADRDVLEGFLVAGSSVLFVADPESNERFELFSVPVDGSAPPFKVSGALVSGGDVQTLFQVVPGGTHVVYVADQDTDEKLELYAAPLDGSATSRKLNGTLIAGGDVEVPGFPRFLPFAISADGARVVYMADQDEEGVSELFSVPTDRSSAPVQISGVMVPGGSVRPHFRITPDGREVLYIADQATDGVFELFRARLGLAGTSLRVNAPLVAGGDVIDHWSFPFFEVTPDSTRVVYVADQEQDGVRELYMAVLAPRRPGALAPGRGLDVKVR